MNKDGPGGQDRLRIDLQQIGGPAQQRGERAEAAAPEVGLGPRCDPDESPGALDRGARGHEGAVEGQGLLGGLGMHRLQPGVEEVADGPGHGAVAVHQVAEAVAEARLGRGMALGQHLGEQPSARRRLSRSLQDLEREAVRVWTWTPASDRDRTRAAARCARRLRDGTTIRTGAARRAGLSRASALSSPTRSRTRASAARAPRTTRTRPGGDGGSATAPLSKRLSCNATERRISRAQGRRKGTGKDIRGLQRSEL